MTNQVLEQFFEKTLKNTISREWFEFTKNYLTIKKFKKNERIFNEGDEVKSIYFIINGKVKVVSYFDKENERILRLARKDDILGHRGISSQYYPISGIALTDVDVIVLPIEIFRTLLKSNPEFSMMLINFLTEDLKLAEDRMKNMIHNEVIVRIGIILCMLIDAYGYDEKKNKKLKYTLSRRDMANFAVTSYETVLRSLLKLEEMQAIRCENKDIYILNEKKLRALVKQQKPIVKKNY